VLQKLLTANSILVFNKALRKEIPKPPAESAAITLAMVRPAKVEVEKQRQVDSGNHDEPPQLKWPHHVSGSGTPVVLKVYADGDFDRGSVVITSLFLGRQRGLEIGSCQAQAMIDREARASRVAVDTQARRFCAPADTIARPANPLQAADNSVR